MSEGEFAQLKEDEADVIDRVMRSFPDYKGGQPKYAVIVAIKRHHTRFFNSPALTPGELKKIGRTVDSGNVPPGTIVENAGHINDSFIVAQ